MRPNTIMSTVWNGDLLCFHCGTHETGVLPGDLDVVRRKTDAFEAAHRKCVYQRAGVELKRRHDDAFAKHRAARGSA